MNIALLQATLKEDKDPGLATFDPRFSDIVTLVQEAKYEDAANKSEEVIAQEIYDIRIIGYFLYGHFLDNGVEAMTEIYQCLADLLGEQLEALGPVKKREKHIQSSLNWLMKQLHKKMQYEESKNSDTYQFWIEQVSNDQIQQAFDAGNELGDILDSVLEDAAGGVQDGLLKVNDWLHAFQPLVYSEEEPEEDEELGQDESEDTNWNDTQEDDNFENEADLVPKIKPEKNSGPTDFALHGSADLNLLLKKLEAFESLITDNKYASAALVADDISSILNNFDPKLYFPKLFSRFFLLFASHFNELITYQKYTDTAQWNALQELYKVDIESFVSFDPDLINLEAVNEAQNDEYASSDDQDDDDQNYDDQERGEETETNEDEW